MSRVPSPVFPRLLGVLQLTRMALVFTAIADVQAALLLSRQWSPRVAVLAAGMSAGLYGFGMALNDIIDQRRDSAIAPGRPLPSGRLGPVAAHLIAAGLLTLAMYAAWRVDQLLGHDLRTLAAVLVCAGFIAFYDVAGKYLVAVGLVTLGLVRFTHAASVQPGLDVPGHALVLLNFTTVLSTLGYALEDKRPTLRLSHVLFVAALLSVVNVAVLYRHPMLLQSPALALVVGAILLFGLTAGLLAAQTTGRRELGKRVMLLGLLWLIVIDAAAVAGGVGWREGLLILALLPIAQAAVWLMQAWSRVVALSQKPDYIHE